MIETIEALIDATQQTPRTVPMTTMSHAEKMKRTRQALIDMYRTKREAPRPGMSPEDPRAWEDPAPAWVFTTVDRILPKLANEPDLGFGITRLALVWCEAGNVYQRAMQIQALAALWIGPLAPMLKEFVTNAMRTKAGRRGKKIHGFCQTKGCACAMPREMVEDIVAEAAAAGELRAVVIPVETTPELREMLKGIA